MRQVIVVKERKEVYHQVVVEVNNHDTLDQIAERIDMMDFYDINEVADYIDEIATVCSVDDSYEEEHKGIWYSYSYEDA